MTGLDSHYHESLKNKVLMENALAISNFILAMKSEINPSDNYRRLIITVLGKFSSFTTTTIRNHLVKYLKTIYYLTLTGFANQKGWNHCISG